MFISGENTLLNVELTELTFKEFNPLRTTRASFAMVAEPTDFVQLFIKGVGLVLPFIMVAPPSKPPSNPRKEFVCAVPDDGHTNSNNAAIL